MSGHLLQGNLGYSFKYPERPVWDLIANGVPVSLQLGGLALTCQRGGGRAGGGAGSAVAEHLARHRRS